MLESKSFRNIRALEKEEWAQLTREIEQKLGASIVDMSFGDINSLD
jgi:hypothetical protein